MTDLIAEMLANPAVGAAGTAITLAAVALWLAAAWWAYADAARRTESTLAGYIAAGWILLSTPLLLPLSLAVYAFARPQVSLADQRTRTLARELTAAVEGPACPACAVPIDGAWLRCPTCTTWLASPCAHCGGWSDPTLDICPWCGDDSREQPFVESPATTGSGATRARRRRLAWRAPTPALPPSQRRDSQRQALMPGAPKGISRAHS